MDDEQKINPNKFVIWVYHGEMPFYYFSLTIISNEIHRKHYFVLEKNPSEVPYAGTSIPNMPKSTI